MNIPDNFKAFYLSFILLISLSNFYPFFAQQDESWKLYDDSHLARVDITIHADTLDWIYQNVESEIEHYAVFRFQNNWIDETVDSIGFRLRGNTSRYSQKKSFKVSFNTFIPGREFYGVDKLNLNGEHNDPSIIRSKLCFDHFNTIGLNASRANHVKVYINGQYYGLYISVEHIDDEFLSKNYDDDSGNLWKCLYPADLVYLGSDPQLYKNLNENGRPVYELKTNEEQGDFSKLVRLIEALNNTPENSFADSIESVIEVHEALKYFAMNILFGEWDDYWSLKNNYYLYHEPAKDIFHLIPYDYDNTYGIDWFNIDWGFADPYNFPKIVSGYRPLAERLISNNQYRNLYTHFIEFYSENVYKLNHWSTRIENTKSMITGAALSDTFRTKDYGFTTNDFFDSYSETSYSNQHVKYGLKQFVNFRNATIQSQLFYLPAKPIAYKIEFEPKNPSGTDSIFVFVSAFSNEGISNVEIQFTPEGAQTQIFPMNFSPVANTQKVDEADRWIGVIPPFGAGKTGYLKVLVTDNQNQSQIYPRSKSILIKTQNPTADNVLINEFMADNDNVYPDPNGEFDDWIELFNPTSSPILLTGKYLTDKSDNLTKWQFIQPNLFIDPAAHLIIWCDEQETQPGIHTNFKLSASGEFLAITENDGLTVIDSITFGQQITDTSFGRSPDGSSNWVFMQPSPGAVNIVTSVDENFFPPSELQIAAYPNPFNPSTVIRFTIPPASDLQNGKSGIGLVTLKIYDLLGKEVATLINEQKPSGTYEVTWNGVNSNGSKASSGIYFARIRFNQQYKNLKLILLK
jgi:hypothetical protein